MVHQALDRAARHGNALPVHLPPYLLGTVDLEVGLPDPLDVRHQRFVPLGTLAAQIWIALPGGVTPVTRRGNLQDLADWLDPVVRAVLIDVALQRFSWRSSSA